MIFPSLLLGLCFGVIYFGKSILKLKKEEITNPKGSLLPLAFSVWGIDIGAFLVSLIIMWVISARIPFLGIVHSEWGIAYENAYAQAVVYMICWALLYLSLLSLSYFAFKKTVADEPKRKKLFFALIGISLAAWAAMMCALYLLS